MAEIGLQKTISWSARILLAATFLAAAFQKILDPVAFASSIDAYRILSGTWIPWTALLLPWIELVIAIGILTPWLRTASASTITALLTVFITLHIISWARGLDINCGCFGESTGSSNYALLILRNCAFLTVVSYVIWDERKTMKC